MRRFTRSHRSNKLDKRNSSDLRYDWTFIYSAISPGKLALVDRMSDVQNLFDSDRSETETARRHDKLEFYSAHRSFR